MVKILVETDSLAAVRLISGDCPTLHPCFNLVSDIKKLMGEEEHIILTHTFREANQVADGFAKHGLELISGCILFEYIPPFVSTDVLGDESGVVFPRGF